MSRDHCTEYYGFQVIVAVLHGLDFELLHLWGGLLPFPPELLFFQFLLFVRIFNFSNLLLDLTTFAFTLLLQKNKRNRDVMRPLCFFSLVLILLLKPFLLHWSIFRIYLLFPPMSSIFVCTQQKHATFLVPDFTNHRYL